MNKIIFALLIAIGISTQPVFSQCDQSLLEQAFDKAGRYTEFQSEYNVKLESGNIQQPVPFAMFKAQLNKGDAYRLAISGDIDNPSRPVIELYDNGMLLGSTSDLYKTNEADVMEFQCDKTNAYDVKIYFQHGYEGCASGILTRLKVSPEINKEDLRKSYDGSIEYGMLSKVQLKLPKSIQDNGIFKSNNGTVEYKNDFVYLRPAREEDIEISILHKEDNSELLNLNFEVIPPRKVEVRLGAFPSGNIRLDWFEKPLSITVYNNQAYHKVASFDLLVGSNTYHITGPKLNNAVWKKLKKLNTGSSFRVENIIIISNEGSQQTGDPLNFYIE